MFKLYDTFHENDDYARRADFCNLNGYVIVEIEPDEKGRRFQIQMPPDLTQEEKNKLSIRELKTELIGIKEDIEQEVFGLVRGDYAKKKARAAEIINELRVLEGKEPRKIQ